MPTALDVSPATVRHINKNHVTISAAKGYSIVLFNVVANEHIEAIVASDDGQETIRLLLEPPGPDRTMVIKRHPPTGVVNILYAKKGPDGTSY